MAILAYVDPVSGALLLQLLVAGFVGTIAFFRKGIWRAISLITRRSWDEPEE